MSCLQSGGHFLDDEFPEITPQAETDETRSAGSEAPPAYTETQAAPDTVVGKVAAAEGFPVILVMKHCSVRRTAAAKQLRFGASINTKKDMLLLTNSSAFGEIYEFINKKIDWRFNLANAMTTLSKVGERWEQSVESDVASDAIPLTKENVQAVLAHWKSQVKHGKEARLEVSFMVIDEGFKEVQNRPLGLLTRIAASFKEEGKRKGSPSGTLGYLV